MFHYKFRLLVCVAKQLCKYPEGQQPDQVGAMMANEEWVDREFKRLESLLELLNHMMVDPTSGGTQDNDMMIWSDEEEAPSRDMRVTS